PRDTLEASRALGPHAALWKEQSLRVILAFQILRHFAAQKAARHRVLRIAAQSGGVTVLDGHHQRAAVRTVQGAHGVANFGHATRLYRGWCWGSPRTRLGQLPHFTTGSTTAAQPSASATSDAVASAGSVGAGSWGSVHTGFG